MTTTINASTSAGLISSADTSGILQLQTANTAALTIDASQNVGVGTASPTTKLHVVGTGQTSGNFTAGFANANANIVSSSSVATGGAGYSEFLFGNATVNNRGYLTYGHASDSLLIGTASNTRVTIDASGNLGLGVTPSAWGSGWKGFQVGSRASLSSSGTSDTILTNNGFNDGTNWKYLTTATATAYTQGSGQHAWYNAASGTAGNAISFTQAMTLDASGNWSLGTTSAVTGYKVHTAGAFYQDQTANGTSGTPVVSGGYVCGPADANIYAGLRFLNSYLSNNASQVAFYVTNTTGNAYEAGRFDSSGNLFVGTTNIGYARKLGVEANGDCTMLKTTGGTTANPLELWNTATSGDNRFEFFYTEGTPTSRGSIDYNRAGGLIRYNTTSDATLKNINGDAPKQVSIDILNSTKIREYSWKDDLTNKPQIGVIAQELHQTFKGAVSVGGDKVITDAEGNETTEYIPWGVDKTAFTFHLVAGWQEHQRIIQEQQAIIQQLQADVAALKGTV